MKKLIQNLIIIITLCSFCFFTYKLYSYDKEEKEQEELKDSLIETAIIDYSKEEIKDKKNNNIPIEVDFKKLKEQNEDIIAWLYSNDTPINYPIVQAKNNDYYLRRMIDGTYNQAGTLFVDCKNSNNFNDYTTIIYGHNMKNATMFGTLINYKSQDYFNEHKEMYLFTENKNYKLQLFAGYTTSSESNLYKFPKTNITNKKLIENAKKNSTFISDIEVTNEDKIIVLSTCSYDFENARYVILGILKEIN